MWNWCRERSFKWERKKKRIKKFMTARLIYANMPLKAFTYGVRVSFVIHMFTCSHVLFFFSMSVKIAIFRIIPFSSDKSLNFIAISCAAATYYFFFAINHCSDHMTKRIYFYSLKKVGTNDNPVQRLTWPELQLNRVENKLLIYHLQFTI